MTGSEQREAARQFINRWRGKGKEDEDGRSYWIELLSNVFGVENVTERIHFEKKVVVDGNTKRICSRSLRAGRRFRPATRPPSSRFCL